MPPRTNSARYADQLNFSVLGWIMACATMLATGGISYALFSNNRVTILTDINKANKAIAISELNTNQYLAEHNASFNRWAIRERLQQEHSSLREIERKQIELARRLRDNGFATIHR